MNRTRLVMTLLCLLMLLVSSTVCMALPYRPHYRGPGTDTTGGRAANSQVYVVNTLADYDPDTETPIKGTLRYGLEVVTGPRFIIFEVGGYIDLVQSIVLRTNHGQVTIAGQTAPQPGITIRRYGLEVGLDRHIPWPWPKYQVTDVVLQHVMFRMGDTGSDVTPVIMIDGEKDCGNIVLDHCSLSWGRGKMITNGCDSLAVLDCILSYSLIVTSLHNGETGMAALNAFNSDMEIAYTRNLFVHCSHRQPWFGAGVRGAVINNIVYGSGENLDGGPEYGYGYMQLMTGAYWPPDAASEYQAGWMTEAAAINNRFVTNHGTGTKDPADYNNWTTGTHANSKPINCKLLRNLKDAPNTPENNPEIPCDPDDPANYGAASWYSRLYLSGNVWWKKDPNQQHMVEFTDDSIYYAPPNLFESVQPDWLTKDPDFYPRGLDLLPGDIDAVTKYVLAHAGARPADRSLPSAPWVDLDKTAVAHTQAAIRQEPYQPNPTDVSGMGSRVHSQSEMGGWLTLVPVGPIPHTDIPADPNGDSDSDGYTNIEEWLEAMAQRLEVGKLPAVRK